MPFERQYVNVWNLVSRSFGIGRPIFNFPAKTNFLGLSEGGAESINSIWQKLLPLRGTDLKIDVLNNRRHQIMGVFVPGALLATFFLQYIQFQRTKVPDIISQVPAPGWEQPAGFSYHHLPNTPASHAFWRKRQELGSMPFDYGPGGDASSIQIKRSILGITDKKWFPATIRNWSSGRVSECNR
eukprot:UN04473